jgi:hypothetical protein
MGKKDEEMIERLGLAELSTPDPSLREPTLV